MFFKEWKMKQDLLRDKVVFLHSKIGNLCDVDGRYTPIATQLKLLGYMIDNVNRRIDGDEMFFNEMIRTHVDMMHKAPKKPAGKKKA